MIRLSRTTNLRKRSQKPVKLKVSAFITLVAAVVLGSALIFAIAVESTIAIIVLGLIVISWIALQSSRDFDLKGGIDGIHLRVKGGEKK